MSDELLDGLLNACSLGFEDGIARFVILANARELAPVEARALYVAALEHTGLPPYVKTQVAVELEWWGFGDLASLLAREMPGLALHIEALEAIASGERCVCEVYAQHRAKSPSPLMDEVGDVESEHPQVEQSEYRCTVCESTWVHRSDHHERGATVYSWRRGQDA